MPRIRTMKPEFWSSPGIGSISPWARLLYAAMWNWADDAGRGTCNMRELQGFAFPEDEDVPEVGTSDGFRRTMSEVRGQFGVIFYKVDGRPYYEIPSWKTHQRNERIAKGRHPASTQGEPWDFMPPTSEGAELPTISDPEERKFRPSGAEAPTTSGPVLKEQGNRGTGEKTGVREVINSLAPQREQRPALDEISGTAHSPAAHTHVQAYAKTCAKRPPGSVLRRLGSAVDELIAADYTDQQIKSALTEWGRKGLGAQHLGAIAHELVNSDRNRHLRPVDDIPDEELTRELLDKELGPDSKSPACAPLDVEEGDPQARKAWYRDAAKRRLNERRAEWRRRRSQQNRTSA